MFKNEYSNENDIIVPITPPQDETSSDSTELPLEGSSELLPEGSSQLLPEGSSEFLQEESTEPLQEESTELLPEEATELLPEGSTELLQEESTELLPEDSTEAVTVIDNTTVAESLQLIHYDLLVIIFLILLFWVIERFKLGIRGFKKWTN